MRRKSKREGVYVNIELIHFTLQQKLTNIVKQLYSNKIHVKNNASFSKRSKNENATTFSLSFFFSLCGVATGLAATGLVGCKHYDVFWPLNLIHYGI